MSSKRLEQLISFLENSPKEPFILFAIAKEYEGLGDKKNALDFYNKIVEYSPSYIGTYYHLGKLLEALEEPEKAFQTYKTGMEEAKKVGDQHSLSELAGAKMELGDDDDFS